MDKTDRTTYAPFILMDDEYQTLFLTDTHMVSHFHVFEEHQQGWLGNGYDWTSVARVVVRERLGHLQSVLDYDPEAGMFSANGPRSALEELGKEMLAVYNDKEQLHDLLSRAELD
jgi:hypothetical protein